MTPLNLLVAQFPGSIYIPMTRAGAAIGYKSQTCYNLFHSGLFPLPVKKVGAKCMVALTDLAAYMSDTKVEAEVVIITETKPRRAGRLTKREEIERRASV